MPDFQTISRRNQEWVQQRLGEDPGFFQKLAQGQAPPFLLVGCSDSRKCPNEMTGLGPGELFVHRNIANQVLPEDGNAQAILEFALLSLEVSHVVVVGHTDCGGVKAALSGVREGAVGRWLGDLRGLAAKHEEELASLPEAREKEDRLSEINVVSQLENVLRSPPFRTALEKGSPPSVHGWIFDLATGYLRELELPRERWRREGLLP